MVSQSLRSLSVTLAIGSCLGCGPASAETAVPVIAATAAGQGEAPAPAAWFEEVAAEAGIGFDHVRALTARLLFPEIMSGGGCWLDHDGDGDLDLYLVQGGDLDPDVESPPNQLYENLGAGADGRVTFAEVGHVAGVDHRGYGMGCAVGDYDGDGDADLYVTNVGANVLYRNEGPGEAFRDVTASAGVGHPGWGTSAAFVDYDGDGGLDLFVVNYVRWSPEREIRCSSGANEPDYCHPANYQAPAADVLYRNQGRGAETTFRDVTAASGVARAFGNGLGVAVGDYDGDGRLDLYVANDGDPNQLWINRGGGGDGPVTFADRALLSGCAVNRYGLAEAGMGVAAVDADGDGDPNQLWINRGGGGDGRVTFADRALLSGCAVNRYGTAEAGMGVAAVDADGDGDLDLFVTHLRDETNTLYLNQDGWFEDVTAASGLAAPSIGLTGFGVGFADFDHDGELDLYVANGRVGKSLAPLAEDPFAEPDQLYRGLGGGRFEEVEPRGGLAAPRIDNGRAVALADHDGDGAVDVLVVNNGGRARLLKNRAGAGGNWIMFRVTDRRARLATGAMVRVSAAGREQWRPVQRAGSYQASHDPRVHFGLGEARRVDQVLVIWPGRRREKFAAVAAGAVHELREGRGQDQMETQGSTLGASNRRIPGSESH